MSSPDVLLAKQTNACSSEDPFVSVEVPSLAANHL